MPEITGPTALSHEDLVARVAALEQLNSELIVLCGALRDEVLASRQFISDFENLAMPSLVANVDNARANLDDIQANKIPLLDLQMENATGELDSLTQIHIPALQEGVANATDLVLEIPKEFEGTELPLDDDETRPLVVGDRFRLNNPDGTFVDYRWNGTEWVESSIDFDSLIVTAAQMKTSRHMFY